MAETDIACSCCGRHLPRRRLHALGDTGAYICRRCGLWVALRLHGDPDDGSQQDLKSLDAAGDPDHKA